MAFYFRMPWLSVNSGTKVSWGMGCQMSILGLSRSFQDGWQALIYCRNVYCSVHCIPIDRPLSFTSIVKVSVRNDSVFVDTIFECKVLKVFLSTIMSCYKNIPFNLFLICLLSLFLVSLVKSEGNLCSKVQEHFLLKGFDISFPDNPAEGMAIGNVS